MSSPDRDTDVPIQSVLAAELDTVRAWIGSGANP